MPLPHKRSLDTMRDLDISGDVIPSAADVTIPMDLDNGPAGSSSGDSTHSETFEQVCDRHVRAFFRKSSLKPKASTQQGLEHGDRTPSGGVFIEGVPRMLGGGNCFSRGDSLDSNISSQADPSDPPGTSPAVQPSPPDCANTAPAPSYSGPPSPRGPESGQQEPESGHSELGTSVTLETAPSGSVDRDETACTGQSDLGPGNFQRQLDWEERVSAGQPNPNTGQLNQGEHSPGSSQQPAERQLSIPDPSNPSEAGHSQPATPSPNKPTSPPTPMDPYLIGDCQRLETRGFSLRGGSAELELVSAELDLAGAELELASPGLELADVAKSFSEGGAGPNDRQPRGFEPLDLPSNSTHGAAVLPEPDSKDEESPPSRARENFSFFRNPETLLSRDPGPSAAPHDDAPGPSTSQGGTPSGEMTPPPTSPLSFSQRVEYLSQQFLNPAPNPGSSSHSATSSFDSKRTSSGGSPDAPRDDSPRGPRGNETVPWRELFDLLPETGHGGPSRAPVARPSHQPGGSSGQSQAAFGEHRRPRISLTISPNSSPGRSIILPGLPDDLAVLCIARVPRVVLAQLKCVSKAWAMLVRSEELYKLRGENGLQEPWLYALCESPRWGPWRVYDPVMRRWHLLRNPMPGADRQLVHAKFSTIALHEKMLVVGGCYFRSGDPIEGIMLEMDQHALKDLRVYDPVKNRWSWAGDMNVARRSFAIGEIGGKVYVAGGLGQNGELLSSAEVYDPSTNRWTLLPSMSVARYGCAGAVLNGRLWAYAGRIQTGEETPGGWRASSSAEVFNPVSATWRTVEEMWMRKDLPNPAAVLDEVLYTVDCEDECKIKCYREATNSWFVVDRLPLPAEYKHAGSRLVAFDGELYMLGGTVFYRDGDLNRGRNVNTVEIFNPKALDWGENTWRSAPNMGEGRGSIWGCAVLRI